MRFTRGNAFAATHVVEGCGKDVIDLVLLHLALAPLMLDSTKVAPDVTRQSELLGELTNECLCHWFTDLHVPSWQKGVRSTYGAGQQQVLIDNDRCARQDMDVVA